MTRPHQFAQRRHTMVVGRGLYLLRYVSAPASGDCPSIVVNQHPVNVDITLIAPPDGSDTHLNRPGDCMVLRAEAPGSLSLVAEADGRSGTIDAEIRLERIATVDQRPSRSSASEAARVQADTDEISILAHVSRRGDVVVEPGEWICGPNLPLPIEGLEIFWPHRPDGVELTYSVASGRAAKRRIVAAGDFAGSRGRAASLTRLELALTGAAAANYELAVDALFLGSAIDSRRGRQLAFSGPSGSEPLVGLRFQIVRALSKPLQKVLPPTAVAKRPTGKVRVYRRGAGGIPVAPMLIESNSSNKGI